VCIVGSHAYDLTDRLDALDRQETRGRESRGDSRLVGVCKLLDPAGVGDDITVDRDWRMQR
jgi:hypothetical protein